MGTVLFIFSLFYQTFSLLLFAFSKILFHFFSLQNYPCHPPNNVYESSYLNSFLHRLSEHLHWFDLLSDLQRGNLHHLQLEMDIEKQNNKWLPTKDIVERPNIINKSASHYMVIPDLKLLFISFCCRILVVFVK